MIQMPLIGEQPIAIRPLKLLFSQHTGCDEHDVPPKPKPIGEQFEPTETPLPRMMPKAPAFSWTFVSSVVTELQHWTGPLLQEPPPPGVPEGYPFLAPYVGDP